MPQPKTKIAIVSHSFGIGGAQRFGALLSAMLDGLGYEIHNIVIEDQIAYGFTGRLYNLGAVCKNGPAIWRKFRKGTLLNAYLFENRIETVIDNRSRPVFVRELITRWIYGKRDKFYVVHSFWLRNYFPRSRWAARLLYADAKKIVCVSRAIEGEVSVRYRLDNTATIYNALPDVRCNVENPIPRANDFILFFGRLDEKVKNFALLLDAFARSETAQRGVQLLIMGEGPDADWLRSEILRRQLDGSVMVLPPQNNPYALVRQARFTILTSRYEGFPMSVIESLALGVPVVSVDCQSGPSEIISDGYNGLLVPNHNAAALAKAIAEFARDGDLYHICKTNAAASVAHLSAGNIAAQWQKILAR